MTMPDRERDRRSLQDLAKMAQGGLLTPPPPSVRAPNSSAPSGVQRAAEAKADDSGVVDLALAAQSDPGAAARAQTTPLAKEGLFDDEPASIPPGPISSAPASARAAQLQQPLPSIPPVPASMPPASLAPASHAPVSAAAPSSAVPASNVHALPAPKKEEKKGKVLPILLGLVAVAAVAAGGMFVVKGIQAKKAAEAAAAAAAAKPAQPAIVAAAPTTPAPEAKAEPTPAPEATLDPNALPTAEAAGKTAAKAPPAKAGAVALAAPAKDTKPAAEAKLSEKDLPTTAAGPAGDLGNAMKSAVGDKDKAEQTPAAGSNGPQFAAGTVPQKPSQGAVTGAIGSVLPGARGCLGPDDPVSRASITFGSAGTVQSVSVSGGAAGKPAEACIKSALSKAKIAPFMEPTYTANITVRPN